MNEGKCGFSEVFNSFFDNTTGISRGIAAPGNDRPVIDLITRSTRRMLHSKYENIYAVSAFIFLLTVCYQIPASGNILHKEGVIHNNIFEDYSFFKKSKNDGDLYLDFYFNLQSDFLTSKICACELIYLDEINPKGIIDFLFTAQKGRDGPVRLIP